MSQSDQVIQKIGETVLAGTETINRLAERVDAIAQQTQQQGYQIFALTDAIQALVENQDRSLARLDQLTETLRGLAYVLEQQQAKNN
ncbi:MAG: hypothetical protein HC886_14510 [Leptolyngbyaceae cyanobacterium SM1_1_3]|nr:hypothetical protein [Leptolyngbyaceae cyanobacterium SM1_1_3]NJN04552.1 hypothetical protein [Leptolyngbyaceae cyanobacterium RM1_1_2]NJO10957.1 hypothetical protein [Leptolyngbyaceae cyanobacterium SL_1_1]